MVIFLLSIIVNLGMVYANCVEQLDDDYLEEDTLSASESFDDMNQIQEESDEPAEAIVEEVTQCYCD